MIINIKDLKKKIIYRSSYRGSKEMDELLSAFVKKYINDLDESALLQLSDLMDLDDENLYLFKQGQSTSAQMHENKIKPQRTVKDVTSDLPVLNDANPTSNDKEHYLRFRNERDKSIFKLLTEDIFNGKNIYKSTDSLKKLYYDITNRHTSVHKYHVLKWDEPSNTIPAHIYKDGLRHIHPDPNQSRTISIREVMRLMTFPDNYKLEGSNGDKYKMLGNAVPPQFSFIVANTIEKILKN